MNYIFVTLVCLAAAVCCTDPPSSSGPESPPELTVRSSELPVSMATLLDEMVSFDDAVHYPSPHYTSGLATSTDARSVSPDEPFWFGNVDNTRYIRMDNSNSGRRLEKVIFDHKGPGAITRIWSTGVVDKTIRFYFDGERDARLEFRGNDFTLLPFPVPDALAQKHTTFEVFNGTSLFLPLPYQEGCKITIEASAEYGFAYHINYRSYDEGTPVRTFTVSEAGSLTAKMNETATTLSTPENFDGGVSSRILGEIAPGDVLKMELPEGSRAVRSFVINAEGNAARYSDIMRGVMLEMTFDGEKTVSVPIGDFSGGGIGAREVQSKWLSADGNGRLESRFVMPYSKNGLIEFKNLLPYAVEIRAEARTVEWTWHTNTLYFHCSWRQDRDLYTGSDYDSNDNAEWLYAGLQGRGVLVGDAMSMYNYGNSWYGEGDEKIWIDGEDFPSFFGTGIEDYYNTSFAPVSVFHTPFGGAVRADEATSHGYNTWLRLRPLDGIVFDRELRFYFELLGWNPSPVIFSSTVWWYGDKTSSAPEASGSDEAIAAMP